MESGPRPSVTITRQTRSPPVVRVYATRRAMPPSYLHRWTKRFMGPCYRAPAPQVTRPPSRPYPAPVPLPSVTTPPMSSEPELRSASQRSGPVPSSAHVPRGATALPTWRQLRKLSREAERKLNEESLPRTTTNMFVSMMAVLTAVSCFPLGVQAGNFTY